MPEDYVRPERRALSSNYQTFIELLRTEGVNTLDMPAVLRDQKEHVPFPLFAFTGAHWDDVAACWATQGVVAALESSLKRRLTHLTCEPVIMRDEPREGDLDLAQLCNIWWPGQLIHPTPYPKTKALHADGETRPTAVIIGTSFSWALLRFFDYHKVFKARDFYYYYQTNYSFPSGKIRKIDHANLDWEKDVFSRDAVIIEINEAVVWQVGFGFIEAALAQLEPKP